MADFNTWTEQTSSGSRSWRGITSSSDGTKLAATVSGGYVYTSIEQSSLTFNPAIARRRLLL